MAIKKTTLLLMVLLVSISMRSLAQRLIVENRSDSIKSLAYGIYKLEIKDNVFIKGKPSSLYDAYPIHYPTSQLFYDQEGRLIKDESFGQKDTTYYNSEDQKIKTIIYPEGSKDSIVISYTYDNRGNIETKKMRASAPKLNYRLDGNYYSYESLIDKFYKNDYLSESDSSYPVAYENQPLELNNYYRLFDAENKLIEEKYLICVENPFPHKADSIIHTISYQYNKDNKLSKVSSISKHLNYLGISYTLISTQQHHYLDQGLTHEIDYFNQDQLTRKDLIKKNDEGMLIEYSTHWINPNKTISYFYNDKGELIRYTATKKNKVLRNIRLEYTYNQRGDWIQCAHFDKKDKPLYLIERSIGYYP